jgi:hypothetical protein
MGCGRGFVGGQIVEMSEAICLNNRNEQVTVWGRRLTAIVLAKRRLYA